jgi:uncharacterized protein (TIGR02231 family)
MKKILVFTLLCFSAIGFAQKPIFTTAKIRSATVYSNSAELLQSASVTLPSGTSEIVIKNVADYVNENTIQIGAPANVTVLSVQLVRDYKENSETTETLKLTPIQQKFSDSINYFENEINKITIEKNAISKTIELLDKKELAGTTKPEITISEFTKLIDYYRVKRNEFGQSIHTLNIKEKNFEKKIQLLQEKLALKKNTTTAKPEYNLILQVMNTVAGTMTLDINYLTNGASWIPFYDMRADNVNAPINLMYKAKVTQNTGIDWKNVKLTLSSGNPNQNNIAPILQAWFLRYGYPRTYNNSNVVYNSLQGQVSGVAYKKDKAEMDESSISNYTTINENQLNISFDIDIPYDILSNGKAHSVALKDLKLPASYKYYAVPKVEKEAFLLAEISEYSKFNLLPGEANIIFEGMYVGKTMINPNQTSDTLNLSMGRDKKIAIKREKIADKSGTKFLSGYKEQTFTFDITVKNNKKEAIELLLKDQYPISTDKEIIIELLDNGKAKVNTETGILTWDVKLGAGETKKFRISYKIKYPKDKFIDNL